MADLGGSARQRGRAKADPRDHGWERQHLKPLPAPELGGGVWMTERSGALEHRISEMIDASNEVAIVCSFLLASDPIAKALALAKGRGVRCYVMTAAEELLNRQETGLTPLDERRIPAHRAMLDELAGIALVRTARHFHAKAVLVDPHSNPSGILSTANLVSHTLGESIDLAMELTPPEVTAVFETLRWGFWETAEREMSGPGRLQAIAPAGRASQGNLGGALRCKSPEEDSITAARLRLLGGAPPRVVATSYGWSRSNPVVKALIELARDGCDVVALGRPDHLPAQEALGALAASGASVVGMDRMHAKVLLTEDGVVVATSNLDPPRPGPQLEIGLHLEGADNRFAAIQNLVESWTNSAPWSR